MLSHFLVQVLDRETIAGIWAGTVVAWNDPAIRRLNPALEDMLPAEPIVLGYLDTNNPATVIEVVKQALESFSAEFKQAFAAANRTFALLPPAQRGTAVSLGNSTIRGVTKWLKVPFLV